MTNRNAGTITQDQKREKLAVGVIAAAYPFRRCSGLQKLKRHKVFHYPGPTSAQSLLIRYFTTPSIQ